METQQRKLIDAPGAKADDLQRAIEGKCRVVDSACTDAGLTITGAASNGPQRHRGGIGAGFHIDAVEVPGDNPAREQRILAALGLIARMVRRQPQRRSAPVAASATAA